MKIVRVFLAHNKADTSAMIDAMAERVKMLLERESKGKMKIEIVAGRDDFDANFKRCGSWTAWARDVVERENYETRETVYRAIVVTNWNVGKATAEIVEFALSKEKPVFILNGVALVPIRSITAVSTDFRSGWEVKS